MAKYYRSEQNDYDIFYERLLLAACKVFHKLNFSDIDFQISEQMVYDLLNLYPKQRLLAEQQNVRASVISEIIQQLQ